MTLQKLYNRLKRKQTKKIIIGNSDQESDWIKHVGGGKYREEELKIHEELEKENKNR